MTALVGHDEPWREWRAAMASGRMHHAWILAGMQGMDALLLGRRTYDIFAGYWPQHDERDVIADLFNRIPKYVASRTPRRLDWAHSVQLDGDVTTAVRAVRDAWLSTGAYVSEEDRVLRSIRSYAMRYLEDVRDANPRTAAPPGGWKYFPLKKSGLLAFTEEQLGCASGSTNTVAVGKILSRAGWLHRNDVRRHRCDVPAELRGLVDESRIFMLVARPILGDLLDTLEKNDRGELIVMLGEPDEDGVLPEIKTTGEHDVQPV